jgi:hypothetical protein
MAKKRGRKPINPPVRARCVNLTDEQVKLLRMWGRGDVSAGLRWLIDTATPMIRRITPTRSPPTPSP